MKKTYKQLREANEIINILFVKNKDIEKTKFGYACIKFIKKNFSPIFTEMQEKLTDFRVENALTDEKTKEILYTSDGKNYKFDREGLKKVIEFNRKLEKEYEAKEFDVESYIAKKDIPELTEDETEILKGLII